ncbi:MAG TPA: SigE family RNA polymerase sigma factor [Nocardioides sp.]|nr:SigE family RNA polymerase sigma factor [Nocardioides sp.]
MTTMTHPAPDPVALYAAHRLGLVRLAVLLVDDVQSAEDVVQDAFAGFLGRAGRLNDPDKALAYLRTAVVNNARSALRRRRTARGYVAPHDVGPEDPSARTVLAEEHREVIAALHRLPERQREVLVLRYWSDLSEGEIADAMGISRGTVKSTASRALAALERQLGTVDSNEEVRR